MRHARSITPCDCSHKSWTARAVTIEKGRSVLTLRGTWMRGGTSKCWLFNAVDLDPLVHRTGDLDGVLTSAFGSDDPRQLDGVGGGSSTTSKAAIVRRSADPDIDIEYLFGQVAIGQRQVEWSSNCGNCATAIGLYALQSGMVPVDPVRTVVRMRNNNTGAVLTAGIDTPAAQIPTEGTAAVPGTNALGVPVALTFSGLAQSHQALLPTGNTEDLITAAGREYRTTMISAGAPAAFFDATDFGMSGSEGNEVLAERLPVLIELRRQAALSMGLARPQDPIGHAVPKVGVVGAPVDYRTSAGVQVAADEYDVSVRMVSMLAPHPAIGLTSAVAVAAAVGVAGTLVAARARPGQLGSLRIGTAAGVVSTAVTVSANGTPDSVTLHRAARRIATAELFFTEPVPGLARLP